MPLVRNSILALTAALMVGAAGAYILNRASYGYPPKWKSKPERTLLMIKSPPISNNEYRLWVMDASHLAYFRLSHGNLSVRLFKGLTYGSPVQWKTRARIDKAQFDRFLRNIYRTGVYDKKPGSRVINDGTYALYVANASGGYLDWGSNDWQSSIQSIAASFFALCPNQCVTVSRAMPGVHLAGR